MDCLSCSKKSCRSAESCKREKFSRDEVYQEYNADETAAVVKTAAALVDGGRAGSLSRIQELLEFVENSGYKKVGLAYCFGMEKEAGLVRQLFNDRGLPCLGISCTCGAMKQSELNTESSIQSVSCNPVSQARQLEAEGVDLAVVIGLCMGHDILFSREFKGDQTTLVVKDRTNGHAPLKGIQELF